MCFAAAASASTAAAEDPAERRFFTPALPPKHQDKPPVRGWAERRVEERLSRGVVALPAADDNVYVGWRLLKSDPPGTTFNVYRRVGGQPVRLKSNAERSRRHYASIKFQGPYTPQRIAAGDLNADGEYDFVLKQPSQGIDPAGGATAASA